MSAITIDNGIAGDGRFEVDIQAAGDSGLGILTYGGGSSTDLIFRMSTLFRTDGSYNFLSDTTTSGPTQTGPRSVQSTGTFSGANGDIRNRETHSGPSRS
jgi:hypothetical protein